MTPQLEALKKNFYKKFRHNKECGILKVDAPCICDLDEFYKFAIQSYKQGQKDLLEMQANANNDAGRTYETGYNDGQQDKKNSIVKMLKRLKIKDAKGVSIDRWNYLIKSIVIAIQNQNHAD